MDELLDTYDINGNFVGVQTREFCHTKDAGVYHKPVGIWIKNSKGQILVQRRSITKRQNPGRWDMPSAGHTLAGDTTLETCVRETYEELGVKTKAEDFKFLKMWGAKEDWELLEIYLLNLDIDIEDITLQKEEVEEVKWLNYDEFIKLLYSNKFCDYPIEFKDWAVEVLK